jgi:hypothetical protein
MSDQTKAKDPGGIWRDQPEEELPVTLKRNVNGRTEELYFRTRSEILMSIGAALLPIGVLAWRLEGAQQRLLEIGFAAVVLWIAISLFWFRHRIWRSDSSRPEAVAATGLEYYRTELKRRRDHLRNEWLWHGPLALASIILIAVLTGSSNMAFRPLGSILPLILLLVAWIGFSFWRRRLQAQELQREINEMDSLGMVE